MVLMEKELSFHFQESTASSLNEFSVSFFMIEEIHSELQKICKSNIPYDEVDGKGNLSRRNNSLLMSQLSRSQLFC